MRTSRELGHGTTIKFALPPMGQRPVGNRGNNHYPYTQFHIKCKKLSSTFYNDFLISCFQFAFLGGSYLKSTETFSNGVFSRGPDLPVPMEFHCLVKVTLEDQKKI